jgi:hypothetical protein
VLIDLANPQKIVVCGFNQSGKTTLVKYLIRNYTGKVFVYDWHNEYKDMPNNVITYVPKMRYDDEKRIEEFNLIMSKFFNKSTAIKVAVVDESNEYNPNMKSLPFASQDLYDNHAHYKQTIIHVTRRPVDINTKLIELAHIRIFFKLFGANDIDYLNRLRQGLGETVSNLLPFHFALLDTFGNVKVCSPIAL